MARFVGGDRDEARAEKEWSQEAKDWFEPIAKVLYVENAKRDRGDPLYPRGIHQGIYWSRGILYPDPPKQLKLKITKLPGDILTDFLQDVATVTDKIKDKIEEIEPGVHQFLPLEIELPDGSISPKRYWLLSNMNRLDTLVLEKSQGVHEFWPNKEGLPTYSDYRQYGDGPQIWAISKAVIAGKAIWTDYKLGHTFFSDDFASWLDAEGIKGWERNDFIISGITVIEV